MKRSELIESLEYLLGDEYDANDLVCCSKNQLVEKIIDVADYYKNEYNN